MDTASTSTFEVPNDSEWIDVKDRLPEQGQVVKVLVSNALVKDWEATAYRDYNKKGYWIFKDKCGLIDGSYIVTHWKHIKN